jgi:hypothetical protein
MMTKDEALKMAIYEIQDLIDHIKARQPNMLFSSSEYVIESCKEALGNLEKDYSFSRNLKVDLYFALGFVMGIVFYQIQKYFF